MSIIVIGGHSRSVGKTSVVAGLIAALPAFHWTALKITQYGHGVCSANGEACDCATADHSFAVSQEEDRSGESDTFALPGRRRRSLLVGSHPARATRRSHAPHPQDSCLHPKNVIIESNSILRFLKPDLYLTVLDPQTADFKTSAQTSLDRADAILLHAVKDSEGPVWKQVSLKPVIDCPTFAIQPPNYVTPEVIAFVRSRLA